MHSKKVNSLANLSIFDFVDNSINPIILLDNNFKIVYLNKAFQEYLDISNLFNKKYTKILFFKKDVKSIDSLLTKVFNSGTNFKKIHFVLKNIHKKRLIALANIFKISDEAGGNYAVVSFTDITPETQRDVFLEEKFSVLQELLKSAPIGICVVDADLKINAVNPALHRMFKYKMSHNLIGKSLFYFVASSEYETIRIFSETINKNKSIKDFKVNLINRQGDTFKGLVSAKAISESPKGISSIIITIQNIEKQHQFQSKLIENELRFRKIFEKINNIAIYITNNKGEVIYWNASAKSIYGYSQHEAHGQKLEQLIIPNGKKTKFKNKMNGWLSEDVKIKPGAFDLINKSGETRTVYSNRVVSKNLNGEIEICFMDIDITKSKNTARELKLSNENLTHEIAERISTELKLKEREKFYHTLLSTSPDAIQYLTIDGNFIYGNQKSYELFKVKNDEALEELNLFNLAEGKHLENLKLAFSKIKLRGTFDDLVLELKRPNGEIFQAEIRASKINIGKENDKGIITIIRDLTDKFLTEELLSEKDKTYKSLFNFSPAGIMLEDTEGNIIDSNPAFCDLIGYSKNELVRKNIFDLIPKSSHPKAKSNLEILKEGNVLLSIVENIKKDNSIVYLELHETLITLRDNKSYILVIAMDISDQKRAEKEITENEFRYRTLFELAPSGIMLQDSKGVILDINPSLCKSLNLSRDEIIGKSVFNIVEPNQTKIAKANLKRILRGEILNHIVENKRKDGSKLLLNLSEVSVPLPDGTAGNLVLANDITDRIEKEIALLEAKEKAENLNKIKTDFLAQMSHEIRSPLNVVLNFIWLLKEEYLNSENEGYFSAIENSSRRVIRTIDMILNMTELQLNSFEALPSLIKIDEDVLQGLISEYKSAANKKGLSLNLEIETPNAQVLADNYSVTQIFSNLIDNAIKYSKKGGIKVIVFRNETHELCISVADTGIGMTKSFIPKLFEEFTQEETGYTRKFEGTGLGMALVKKYCDANNATISVSSRKNRGTTFTICFTSS